MDVRALAKKSCRDCHTTMTPLWRAGPDGQRSLCKACGIRYRKRRRAILDLDKGGAKKSRKKNRTRRGHANKVLMNFGRNMEQHPLLGRQIKLKEEEEAAMLLMALSCGFLCTY
ncbi:GATA transcription factor 16-like [Gastrolobium bilobum]|uniref:GATA transcription factor 16-like n=1 Tax=Gastrolobium bilobum TaxID=150636 RepID=UPI002AB26A3F|nr:GATA transcription factor 16-like [Gastrolobium bilobum]